MPELIVVFTINQGVTVSGMIALCKNLSGLILIMATDIKGRLQIRQKENLLIFFVHLDGPDKM